MVSEKAVAQPGFVVDIKAWRMKDYRRFMKATEANDFDGMFESLALAVKEWPFAGNPTQPEAYDELTMDEWLEVTRAVSAAMSNQFSQGN